MAGLPAAGAQRRSRAMQACMGTPKAMVSDEQGFHGVHANTLSPRGS